MKYSEIKNVKSFCASLFSSPNWREVMENIIGGEIDFEINGVRFIAGAEIDRIQQDELSADPYMLGAFTAWFLSDILDCPVEAVEALQKKDEFEVLGNWVIDRGKIAELQQNYVRHDGYGHYFNGYDFSEEELRICGNLYHVFDCRNNV